MSLRHELASLLAGFDVERVRRERDEAVYALGCLVADVPPTLSARCHESLLAASLFIDRLPIGAVDAARKRLAKGGA